MSGESLRERIDRDGALLVPEAVRIMTDVGRFPFHRVVGGAAARPDNLILVENFPEELKAKVKPR